MLHHTAPGYVTHFMFDIPLSLSFYTRFFFYSLKNYKKFIGRQCHKENKNDKSDNFRLFPLLYRVNNHKRERWLKKSTKSYNFENTEPKQDFFGTWSKSLIMPKL